MKWNGPYCGGVFLCLRGIVVDRGFGSGWIGAWEDSEPGESRRAQLTPVVLQPPSAQEQIENTLESKYENFLKIWTCLTVTRPTCIANGIWGANINLLLKTKHQSKNTYCCYVEIHFLISCCFEHDKVKQCSSRSLFSLCLFNTFSFFPNVYFGSSKNL